MSTFPIHVFVAPDGTWYGANQTDQAHVNLEKAKRVRTRTIRLPGCQDRGSGGRPLSPLMRRALWLHAVKGYSISGALRVLGHPSPETNGRRQLQRLVKRARAALHELRCSRAIAA